MESKSLLMKKYREYLIPSIMSTLSLALNEFVDCMLVSQLLGSDALAIMNMTFPVIFVIDAFLVMFGNGGAILYAVSLGRWETKKAGQYYSFSMLMAVISGFLILGLGILFRNPVINLLCVNQQLRADYQICYLILICSAPVIIVYNTLLYFMPTCGAPAVATAVNIISNFVNLIMDIVFIKLFHTDIRGAFWATLSGQIAGLSILFLYIKFKPVYISRSKISFSDLPMAIEICKQGAATSVLQIFYALKTAVMNKLAQKYGGETGVIVYSLCIQTFSVSGVFLLGVSDTAQPLIAMLSGQKDYRKEAAILKGSLLMQILFSAVLTLLYEFLPQLFILLYGVSDPALKEQAMHGIRLVAFTFLTRAVGIQYMRYLQVEKHKGYAFAISLFDGIAPVPLALIMVSFLGLDGVILSYPVASFLMLVMIFLVNLILYFKAKDEYTNVLLIRREEKGAVSNNYTIADDSESREISQVSEQITIFCREKGVSEKRAMQVGLLCEEMSVYTVNHRSAKGTIDILLRITQEKVELGFRSIGAPFDPLSRMECDVEENIVLLQKISSGISYEYIMGMNNTKIMIERN